MEFSDLLNGKVGLLDVSKASFTSKEVELDDSLKMSRPTLLARYVRYLS